MKKPCEHDYDFDPFCGAHVCTRCEDHKGLARCYCGWSLSGADGRQELEELGETIDPEPYIELPGASNPLGIPTDDYLGPASWRYDY